MSRYPLRKTMLVDEDSSQEEYELAVHLRWIGDVLEDLRRYMNMTQKEFAEHLGMPQCRISHIENGGVDLKISTLIRLAAKLEVDPRIFFPDKEELKNAAWRAGGWGVKRPGVGRLKERV